MLFNSGSHVTLVSVLTLYVSSITYITLFDSRIHLLLVSVLTPHVFVTLYIRQFDSRYHATCGSVLIIYMNTILYLHYLSLKVMSQLVLMFCVSAILQSILFDPRSHVALMSVSFFYISTSLHITIFNIRSHITLSQYLNYMSIIYLIFCYLTLEAILHSSHYLCLYQCHSIYYVNLL